MLALTPQLASTGSGRCIPPHDVPGNPVSASSGKRIHQRAAATAAILVRYACLQRK